MFLDKEVFNTKDINYSDIPEQLYQKHKEQYVKNTIKLLEKEGSIIIPPTASA